MTDTSGYFKTSDITERLRFSKSTLHRRMNRTENPFPKPVRQHNGSESIWLKKSVLEWEAREFNLPPHEAKAA